MLEPLPDWKQMAKADKLAVLPPMIAENLSASQIAERFRNCTKNSVLGFCHKNGLKVHGFTPPPPPPAKPHGNKGQPKADAIVSKIASRKSAPHPLPPQPYDVEDHDGVDVTHLVGLLDLERRSCRWPVTGEGSGTLFCGQHANHGPYCPEHSQKAGKGYGRGAQP